MQPTTEPASDTFRIFVFPASSPAVLAGAQWPDPITRDSMLDGLKFAVELDPTLATAVSIVAPNIILNHQFSAEVASAISDPGLDGIEWLALVSDGVDISGTWIDAGNYLEDPATPAARPLRLVGRTEPAIAVIAVGALQSVVASDAIPNAFSNLVDTGAVRGLPVFASHRLRFASLQEQVAPPATSTDVVAAIEPASIRPDPTLSVVVRTTTSRPAMIERNLAALAREHSQSSLLEVIVTSTDEKGRLADVVADAGRRHPSLPAKALPVEADGAASRSATMLAGLTAACGDYVWYVDDDDWIAAGSVERIKDSVHGVDRPILVGAVEAFEESWNGDQLLDAAFARRYLPREWYRAFTGWNFLPNCSLVIPRAQALTRASAAPPQSDLGEDYALQLLLFTAPGSTIHVIDETIANISWRKDGDSVVALEDRTPWLRDLSSHISDLSRDPGMSTAAWWRLGAAVRELPYPDNNDKRPASPSAGGDADPYTPHPLARIVPRSARPMIAKIRRQFRRSSG